MTFDDLLSQYGEPRDIPNDDLYSYLTDIRMDLANRASMGSDGLQQIKTSKMGVEVRRRSKQDLVWLAGYFTWDTNPFGVGRPISENEIREDSHGVICRQFFVQKDDSKILYDQSPIKNRLILWPRGGAKTTLDIADTIQWILNFPDMRILFLSAETGFATDILDEMKGHFVVKLGEPSLMNLFFPDFCVEEKDMGAAGEFTSPVWAAKQVRRREATVMAYGMESTLSGKHFELIKGDDMVSNRNSENDDQCRKVTKNFGINKKMLMPGGYVDLIGTRYSDVDMYGDLIEKNQLSMVGNQLASTERGHGWVMTTNPDMAQIILIGRAIQIKPEVEERLEREGKEINYMNAGEDGCIVLLPRTQTYKFLCGDYTSDEIAFEGQRNQNPRPAFAVTFDEALLKKNTIPFQDLPRNYVTTHFWDLAYSQRKGADSSVGSSVMWDSKGQMFVHDLVRGKFKPSELTKELVAFTKKWKPSVVAIEDSMGAKNLEQQLQLEARRTGDPVVIHLIANIRWMPVSNVKEAKKSRMASMHPWFVDGRCKILNSLPHLETLYKEFEKCLVSHHHDDIPDNLSRQLEIAAVVPEGIARSFIGETVAVDRATLLLQRGWNLIFEENCDAFGVPGAGAESVTSMVDGLLQPADEEEQERRSDGMDSILGFGLFG